MYAIVDIAGQQFKVEAGMEIFVNRLAAEKGAAVEFDKVLLIDADGAVKVGAPYVDGAKVTATVLDDTCKQRVEQNGILLSTKDGKIREDVNIKVVRFFAYLHDKCRLNDWKDLEHGVRAADMLPTIRDTILKSFTDEEVSLLEKACRYHTTRHRTGNPTIDVCFDADRLDLGRVGIVPNPKLMATEQGAYYAKNILWIDNLNSNKSL